MNYFEFERAVLRLKEIVGVQTDVELAALLGMEKSAFNKRKARGSFPKEAVEALVAARPDLQIDMHYVITGETQLQRAQREAGHVFGKSAGLLRQIRELIDQGPQDDAEVQLVEDWRRCDPPDRKTVSELAARLAKRSPDAATSTQRGKATGPSSPSPRPTTSVKQHFNASVGQAAGRDVVNYDRGKGRKR
ncbi:helix-turn-helix domain-containing protein [Caldimonas sp. KR1-144]|uniref:helix-turn-helix domain-containing protein n=1 Tax=Caldimonas sp. KR1-144 TaxID=3400911 RepID=UPI003C086233